MIASKLWNWVNLERFRKSNFKIFFNHGELMIVKLSQSGMSICRINLDFYISWARSTAILTLSGLGFLNSTKSGGGGHFDFINFDKKSGNMDLLAWNVEHRFFYLFTTQPFWKSQFFFKFWLFWWWRHQAGGKITWFILITNSVGLYYVILSETRIYWI